MVKKPKVDLLYGLKTLPSAIKLSARGTPFYKETPQVKGRIARALAKNTKGGKGLIKNRPQYKKHLP